MIVDSSAIVAIVFKESGYEDLLSRMESAPMAAAGAPTLAETGIVLSARLGEVAVGLLEWSWPEVKLMPISLGPGWQTTESASPWAHARLLTIVLPRCNGSRDRAFKV